MRGFFCLFASNLFFVYFSVGEQMYEKMEAWKNEAMAEMKNDPLLLEKIWPTYDVASILS